VLLLILRRDLRGHLRRRLRVAVELLAMGAPPVHVIDDEWFMP